MEKRWIKDGEFYQDGKSVVIYGVLHLAPISA